MNFKLQKFEKPFSIFLIVITIVSGIATILTSSLYIRTASVVIIFISFILLLIYFLSLNKIKQDEMIENVPNAPYQVIPATEDDICCIADTAKKVYSGIDIMPVELMTEWCNLV